uniref:Uncharacterized protein n=1 Tax=Romanomermis culicivorax TaxID=13658 RepID=A0A915LAT2_ROMCU
LRLRPRHSSIRQALRNRFRSIWAAATSKVDGGLNSKTAAIDFDVEALQCEFSSEFEDFMKTLFEFEGFWIRIFKR